MSDSSAEHGHVGAKEMHLESGDVKVMDDGTIVGRTSTGEEQRVTASFALDPVAERKLVWKLDTRILPVLAVMYLFNALDKANLGNAKTAGLEKDLGMVDEDYNLALSIFFIPYVLTAPFLGIIGKKYGPNRVLPAMMMTFGMIILPLLGFIFMLIFIF